MTRRKGWHRKKRNRMPVQHWPAVIARAAEKTGMVEKIKAEDDRRNPMLAAFDLSMKRTAFRRLGKPTMQLARRMYMEGKLTGPVMVPMSREELLEMYPNQKRKEVMSMGCGKGGKKTGGKRP